MTHLHTEELSLGKMRMSLSVTVTEKFGETSRECFSSQRALTGRNSFLDQTKH